MCVCMYVCMQGGRQAGMQGRTYDFFGGGGGGVWAGILQGGGGGLGSKSAGIFIY